MIRYHHHPSPLGPLLLAATDHGLCGVYFEGHKHFKGIQGWQPDATDPHIQRAACQLDEYFSGRRTVFDLTLDANGTAFQHTVWRGLCQIPFGGTASYTTLAHSIGNPKALRAAAAANGRNPLSIIVPCHRVIGAGGDLVGYAGGLERKRWLLAWEARERD